MELEEEREDDFDWGEYRERELYFWQLRIDIICKLKYPGICKLRDSAT